MKTVIYIMLMGLFMACARNNESASVIVKDNWTENEKIHLYKDCKDKLLNSGETEESAHAFCECVLLKVVELYSTGQEAMENLTDSEIEKIEKSCIKTETMETEPVTQD